MTKPYVFTNKTSRVLILTSIIGLVMLFGGLFLSDLDSHRIWANVLLNGFLIIGLALGGAFFVAVHAISESGWQTSVQRIAEAMGSKIWLGAIMILPIVFGVHSIYHWSHTESLDYILQMKKGYLNLPFFAIRMFIYFAGWIFLFYKIRQLSILSDNSTDVTLYIRTRTYAALFMVFFAITGSTSAWDWIMSIDAHWFSTLFGWYTFIGLFVNSLAVLIIILILLQKNGYMQHVNDEHLHDLGKYLFGFSIFWAYLWVSQYLLIWYSNIPEETIYYVQRIEGFEFLFYLNVIVCFAAPFFALMSRGNKRKTNWLLVTSIVVFIGHWIDLFVAIMPGAVGAQKSTIGLFEIGLTVLYISVFAWFVLKSFAKANVVPQNHPYYKESFDYENIK